MITCTSATTTTTHSDCVAALMLSVTTADIQLKTEIKELTSQLYHGEVL